MVDQRDRARQSVHRALKAGRLTKGPCEQRGPGCHGIIEAHHDDYSKPLDVRWLCVFHHRLLHFPTRPGAGIEVKPMRPGRPRKSELPRKLAVRLAPDLYRRLDDQLAVEGDTTTQRAFIERALARELDDPQPPSEGAADERTGTLTGARAT